VQPLSICSLWPRPTTESCLLQSFFDPVFLAAIRDGSDSALRALVTLEAPTGIYSFSIFTAEFASQLLEELAHFENFGLPVSRPNSMNNYGVILDDIGMRPFLAELRQRYLLPLTSLLFAQVGGASLDSHHGFMVRASLDDAPGDVMHCTLCHATYSTSRCTCTKVQYRMTEDLDLGFHYDDAEVTLNLCLGRKFTGMLCSIAPFHPHCSRLLSGVDSSAVKELHVYCCISLSLSLSNACCSRCNRTRWRFVLPRIVARPLDSL
jgi:hypothetical protein